MFNNLTVKQIAVLIASAISVINALLLIIWLLLTGSFGSLLSVLLFILISFGSTYTIVSLLLSTFVFQKLKMIYKIISKKKSKKDFSLATSNLTDVNDEVIQWAQDREEEIIELKNLENYRRNFVGNISHELKTPIFSIQGYLHTLLDGGLHDDNINQKYIKRAASNVQRLQSIVEDLEVINQLESGNAVFMMTHFDIGKLTLELFEDLKFRAKENKINLSTNYNPTMPIIVFADKDRIRQVLDNLITNSLKYGKMKGKTKVSFHSLDENILVEISDNGIGIGKKHLNHLFDRFYRVDSSRSRAIGGSGLGLSIVKHIIEAHNQTINVHSSPDEGSTFDFLLPKKEAKNKAEVT